MQNKNSLEAFENIKPKIPTDHDLILSVLKKDKDATYKEIGYMIYKKLLLNSNPKDKLKAYAWKHDPNKVSRRMSELVDLKRAPLGFGELFGIDIVQPKDNKNEEHPSLAS